MIVAGLGFRKGASVESLRSAYEMAAQGHVVAALATAEDKAGASCLVALAEVLGLPVVAVAEDAVKAAQTVTQSPRVQALRGTGSLAEAVALSAAGDGARLAGPRQVSADRQATCAIALGAGT